VKQTIRRLAAGLTLTAATFAGTALTTVTAHADDTTTVESVDTPALNLADPTGPVVTPLDTHWG
jgi:hypothetical protein